MHKSGKIKLCLLSLPLIVVAVAAVGCGKGNHTHTYSSEWAFNEQTHWHPSTCSHDTKANKSDHTYTTTVIPPSVTSAGYTLHICACGYSYTTDPVGSLPVESGELRYNEDGHWKTVLSGEQVTVENHEFSDTTIDPTCTTYGYTKHSCACGYWFASNPTAPTAHRYDENVWGHDENSHWHSALCCDSKSAVSAHHYTERVVAASCDQEGYTEFTCTDCGYTYEGRRTPASHAFADTFDGDDYWHWRPATCEHNATETTDRAEHALVGTSNVCVVCKKAVTPRLAYTLSENKEYYIVTGRGCTSDRAIEIPDTYLEKPVQEIAARAFKDEDITSVRIGANVKKIGTDAFAGAQIASLVLPSGLEEIGTRAFTGTKITALTLGASLQKLGYEAFRNCTDLKTVEIKADLSVLPPYVFEGCSSLQSVSCATKITQVGAQAFLNCAQLTSLDLIECTKVGFSAFAGCSKFVPAISQYLSVAEDYAFAGCAIQSASLPVSLTQISNNLFSGCEKLKSVTLTASSVGSSAFEGCALLDYVIMNSVQVIGDGAFKGCSSLTSLILPDTVIRVGKDAFANSGLISQEDGVQYAANVVVGLNEEATSASIKSGTVGIADEAFRGNTILNSVNLGSVRFIGVSAFRGCQSLTAIDFTASVKLIGANAFRESGLTSVAVPATVYSVGDNAFYDCKSLTTVTVNAKEIGRFAFSYTGEGRDLNHPVKQRPTYAKLASVTIGSGVTTIGSNAFQYCPITSVTLPAGLTTIGKYAFAQTDLESIAIPASVTRIGEYAFYSSKLTSATFASEQGWKAGKTSLNLGSASQNATYLKTNYVDIDWIKE